MKKNKLFWIAAIILLICLPLCFGAYEDVIGIYNVIRGGTGNQTLTDHGVLLGSGTDPITVTDSGADGEVLVSNDASADPDWEYIPRQNLLTNTQRILCSNSDTNKGIAIMTYDAGAAGGGDIPDPGDSGTGGTSGATCKIISVTVSTGAFATNDATGTIEIGASAGRFHDNETVTFTDGETVVVNHPNSAVGVDLMIQNGEFSIDTDPPPGWTSGASATLTTEAGGKIGNCLMITENGSDNPYAYQNISVIAGKIYYFLAYAKAGTEASYLVKFYDVDNANYFYTTGTKEETAGDWSTNVSRYFEAPSGCTSVRIFLMQICSAAAGTTIYYDEISCYEVTPGCTGADALAFDGWWKDTTLDVYREHSGSNTTDGSFYADKSVPSAQNDFMAYPTYYNKDYWYIKQQGRTITVAGYAESSTANDIKLFIYDGAYTYSSAHSGGGSYEWLEATDTISATATSVYFGYIHTSATPGIAYVSQPIASYGSSIGAGNYVPESDRRIYAENDVASQAFNAKTGTNGFSDVSATELNLEADSQACIGKGVKAVRIALIANDSASAGTNCYIQFGYDVSAIASELRCQPYGKANDTHTFASGFVSCNSSGNYKYIIEASGSTTFDIQTYKYTGIEWR